MRVKVASLVAIIVILCTSLSFASVVSNFDDGTLDGWTASGDGSISNPGSGGNPGGFLKATDPATGPNTWGIAPSKFLGDWSSLNGAGFISFDMILLSGGPPTTEKPNVYISGPGGSAICFADNKITSLWQTFVFPIAESMWEIKGGSWNTLLTNVTELKVDLEQIQGKEVTGIDNVVLSQVPIPGAIWLLSSALIGLICGRRVSRAWG